MYNGIIDWRYIMQVRCPKCGLVDVDTVKCLNIEEGMQGEDIVTFECSCGTEAESAVYGGDETENEEYYNDDMDGDFESGLASAGWGTDESYIYDNDYFD
jgi:hypothetical protein